MRVSTHEPYIGSSVCVWSSIGNCDTSSWCQQWRCLPPQTVPLVYIQVQGARGWLYVFADEKDGTGRRRYIACTLSRMWAHVRRTAFAQVSEEDLEVSLSGVPDMHLYEVCVCLSNQKQESERDSRRFLCPRARQAKFEGKSHAVTNLLVLLVL